MGTTAVETILKIPVVTPQNSASATIAPGRPVVTMSAQAAAASSSQAARPLRGGQVLRDHDRRDVGLVAGEVEHAQLEGDHTGPGAEVRDRKREPEGEEAP